MQIEAIGYTESISTKGYMCVFRSLSGKKIHIDPHFIMPYSTAKQIQDWKYTKRAKRDLLVLTEDPPNR